MVLDISIFLSFVSFCIILGIIGMWKRMPILMLIGGAMIAFLMVIPMDFRDGSRIESLNTTTDIIIPTYQDQPVEFDVYPKIFFGIMGSMFMIAGALVWKFEEN